MNDPFDTYNGAGVDFPSANDVSGNFGMQQQGFDFNFNGGLGNMPNYGSTGMNFDPHTYSGDMGMGMPVQTMAPAQVVSTQRTVPINNGAQAARYSVAPSDGSYGQRARSVRKASQQASDGWRRQKHDDEDASAEKSSEEDSQISEFNQSEEEEI